MIHTSGERADYSRRTKYRVYFGEVVPAEGTHYHIRDTLGVNHLISELFLFDVNMILAQGYVSEGDSRPCFRTWDKHGRNTGSQSIPRNVFLYVQQDGLYVWVSLCTEKNPRLMFLKRHIRLSPAIIVCSLPRSVNHVFHESLHIGRIPPYGDQKSIEME